MDERESTGSRTEQSEGASSRPSLNERLMNSPKPETTASDPAPGSGSRDDSGQIEKQAFERAAEGELRTLGSFGSVTSAAVSSAMKEARRFVRVRYFTFLALLALLGIVMVVSLITLANFLLEGGTWEEQAASGAVAGGALLLLLVLLYRPAGTYSTAAVELAQLESLRVHLEKSYMLWDDFLANRDGRRELTANDLAVAVSSMTSATRDMVALQATYIQSHQGQPPAQPPRPAFPTPTSPDPRRY